ncbi:MAG: redoxin domain-containing protein [Xanthomonadales bacterium]|nr:TlpA family protein disulfide reductase [Xanthomonadales bacterium]NIX13123.1 redoxin domain-containing protein [Xanthomonadales bacterium]
MKSPVPSLVLLLVLAGLLGGAAGWMFTRLVLEDSAPAPQYTPPPDPQELLGQRRPDFTLGSTVGERVSASDFDGQVLLLNFWATWCVPCRAEMPMLSELHEDYSDSGLRIVGIALDDVQSARDFAQELGIAYTILVGTTDVMATGLAYGNRAGLLPYSVLIDRYGIVRWTHLGELDEAELKSWFEALLP